MGGGSMTKYTDMQARARKAGLWPLSKEQAYYAGLEEGASVAEKTINAVRAEALDNLAGQYYGAITPDTIRMHAQQLRNGEKDNE